MNDNNDNSNSSYVRSIESGKQSALPLVLDFVAKPSAKQQPYHHIAAIEVSMTAT